MQRLSVFDMLKVGVGPSSSHTMGPWRAAERFLLEVGPGLADVVEIAVDLFGSLAKTGRGHGTDVAVQLGLCGEDPQTIAPDVLHQRIAAIAATKRLRLCGSYDVSFDPRTQIRFRSDQQLPYHPNGMRFTATLQSGAIVAAVYYSVGGGFIVREEEPASESDERLPFPIDHAEQLLGHCRSERCSISEIVRRNELSWRTDDEIRARLATIRSAMIDSVYRGAHTDGVLPGGLNVQRRAAAKARRLLPASDKLSKKEWLVAIGEQADEFSRVLDWVTCFALAVNEENAAFGRIVTAPTNGAAGVIPAVLLYGMLFRDLSEQADAFLLTAGEIGCIFKKGATISAALGGCQAEIGVSSAMAAAALTECLGGSPPQAAVAAEIAMEHHLGMTCDPIGGLVQIPCIERNAMGAIKAITAAQMALQRDAIDCRVSLDAVIRTMWETALDMHGKYKETSEGGLAVQIEVNLSEC